MLAILRGIDRSAIFFAVSDNRNLLEALVEQSVTASVQAG